MSGMGNQDARSLPAEVQEDLRRRVVEAVQQGLSQTEAARVFLHFLGRLLRLTRKTRKKVFLIIDGHPVHKSRSVTRWLAEHREQIRIFFLRLTVRN